MRGNTVKKILYLYITSLLLGFIFPFEISAKSVFTLSRFLDQVKSHNQGYQAYEMASVGYKNAAKSGLIAVAPAFFQDFEFDYDKTPRLNPLLDGNGNRTYIFKTGIQQNTLIGLDYQVYQQFERTNILGPTDPTQVPLNAYYDTKYAISVTQDLWSNFFGRLTKATYKATKANSLYNSYTNSFSAKTLLSQAELAYVSLGMYREAVNVAQSTVRRYRDFQNWMDERLKLNLVLDSDLYQAKSALVESQLALQNAINLANGAARQLNILRGRELDTVGEKLQSLATLIKKTHTPELNIENRDDIRAAKENEKYAVYQLIEAQENIKPTLTIGADTYLHSRSGSNFIDGFNKDEISVTTTLSLNVPLSIGLLKKTLKATKTQEKAARMSLDYQIFYDLRQWDSYEKQLKESKKSLSYSRKLEYAQFQKMRNEIAQHQLGLSTTYQVLQFMQDYFDAQTGRIQAQALVMQVLINMKLYGGGA